MINFFNQIRKNQYKAKMILQIHDELLFEVPKNELRSVCEIVTFEMENAIVLDVPIKVDSNYGLSWFDAH